MRRILITVCILFLFFSCSDDDSDNQEPQNDNFYALTVGNSWEYRYYRYDIQNDNFQITEAVQYVSIVSSEDIDGAIYFKYRYFTTGNDNNSTSIPANGESFKYLREDSGNLVDQNNHLLFIREDNEERLVNYIDFGGGHSISEYRRLLENSFSITTEAGIFETIAVELFSRDEEGNQFGGNQSEGNAKHFYANGIGAVLNETTFAGNPQHFLERRLQSYNVQ